MELSGSNIKKKFIFSQKESFDYTSGNRNPKKLLTYQEVKHSCISESIFPSSENKKLFLIVSKNKFIHSSS